MSVQLEGLVPIPPRPFTHGVGGRGDVWRRLSPASSWGLYMGASSAAFPQQLSAQPEFLVAGRSAQVLNLRFDEVVARFANASGVGLEGVEGAKKVHAKPGATMACCSLSFSTGALLLCVFMCMLQAAEKSGLLILRHAYFRGATSTHLCGSS